ncbi:MAG: hypothetical protein NT150_07845 [Bacteroidetes bacterium]|nr:hypothetical protein [Bacteroidota bacterium]
MMILVLSSCSKKATLYENYWETIESGAYVFIDAKVLTYNNGVLISDSAIDVGDSYILLYTEPVLSDGFFNQLKRYGDWESPFFNNLGGIKAWNMENDDQRLTFSVEDFSGTYIPQSTITIEDVGEKKQTWHYVKSAPGTYIHYIVTMERTNAPK